MKLKSNFIKYWHDLLKDILVNHWGFDISGVDENDLPIVYFNAEQRRIDPRRRKIEISDIFRCPAELQKGWDKIQREISNGYDITPHLSKFVNCIDRKDPMLNDWGVYHFHLGDELNGDFIKRTGPLLFALVTNECLYAINVYSHGQWTNNDIVEVIHRNWPNVIKQYIVNGIALANDITDAERKILRHSNANAFVQVSDGTIYAPIGGGTVSSGYNLQSIIRMDKQHAFLKHLQSSLESQLSSIRPELEKQGYNGEPELIAKLEITETEYRAVFPEYSLRVILHKKA
jgi:hypothetical protein